MSIQFSQDQWKKHHPEVTVGVYVTCVWSLNLYLYSWVNTLRGLWGKDKAVETQKCCDEHDLSRSTTQTLMPIFPAELCTLYCSILASVWLITVRSRTPDVCPEQFGTHLQVCVQGQTEWCWWTSQEGCILGRLTADMWAESSGVPPHHSSCPDNYTQDMMHSWIFNSIENIQRLY